MIRNSFMSTFFLSPILIFTLKEEQLIFLKLYGVAVVFYLIFFFNFKSLEKEYYSLVENEKVSFFKGLDFWVLMLCLVIPLFFREIFEILKLKYVSQWYTYCILAITIILLISMSEKLKETKSFKEKINDFRIENNKHPKYDENSYMDEIFIKLGEFLKLIFSKIGNLIKKFILDKFIKKGD